MREVSVLPLAIGRADLLVPTSNNHPDNHLVKGIKKMKKERYPQNVVASIVNMVDAIEDNLREIIAEEIKNMPLQESDPQPKLQQTDMHGEPVAGDSATPLPVYGRRHPKGDPEFWKNYDRPLSKGHEKIVTILRQGFVAVPTLAGMTGLKASTVHAYLQDLKRNGFTIEKKNVGRRFGRRGYNKIYRLAS